MKTERIDEILLRLGYVTDEQISQALVRQRTHGGRLGSHLLHYGYIVEEQMVHALSIQHDVPGFRLGEHKIDKNIVNRFPGEEAQKLGLLPISIDKKTDTIAIAIADPQEKRAIKRVREIFGISNVKMLVAPETLLYKLIVQLYQLDTIKHADGTAIELPELFDGQEFVPANSMRDDEKLKPVLMICLAQGTAMFLRPVFKREGYDLRVASDVDQAAKALREGVFERILIAPDAVDEFAAWQRQKYIDPGNTEVTRLGSISDTLMNTPAPYKQIVRSLMRSLQIIAEGRCAKIGWIPPYLTIADDVARMARRFGFDRVALDGLRAASHLLLPGQGAEPSVRAGSGRLTFIEVENTLSIARTLHFPWDIHGALEIFVELLALEGKLDKRAEDRSEVFLGAQFLVLAWFRHISLADVPAGSVGAIAKIKTRLRGLADKLARLDVIEAYVSILEDEAKAGQLRPFNQVFVVGRMSSMSTEFVSRIKRAGFQTVLIEDIAEALRLCERQAPAAVLVHRESFPKQMTGAGSAFRQTAVMRLFAFSAETEASTVLDLLDAGFDDVFVPPHDYDIISARITKSLSGMPDRKSGAPKQGSFSASFQAFSFIDLVQALGQSLRSVKVTVRSSGGEAATLYMNKGRLVHAKSKKLAGEDAIYHIIRWGDDGEFDVEPETTFPAPNIEESNEGILMEGCRLLDESTA